MALNAQMVVAMVFVASAALFVKWWMLASRPELRARAKRGRRYNIRPLTWPQHADFSTRWLGVQSKCVDDPAATVTEADALVAELMTDRGYPMSDSDPRAQDVPKAHPHVVHYYREAHDIAERHARQVASTEELRQAVVLYRALFDDLLEVREPIRKRA